MNRRKASTSLSNADVKAILHLHHCAARAGFPLTVMLTAKLANGDAHSAEAQVRFRRRIINLVGQYARRHGFPVIHLHTLEIAPNQTGEHMHLLCHVPSKRIAGFIAAAENWGSVPGEIVAKPASQTVTRTVDGKLHSAVHYIVKQMSPQAAFKRPFRRIPGGTIIGRRWNASHALKALERLS